MPSRVQRIRPAVHGATDCAIVRIDFAFVEQGRVIVRADVGDRMKPFAYPKDGDLKFFVKFHARTLTAQNLAAVTDLDKCFSMALKRREIIIGKNVHTLWNY